MRFPELHRKSSMDHGTRLCSGPSSTAECGADEVGNDDGRGHRRRGRPSLGGPGGRRRGGAALGGRGRVVVGVGGSSSALAAVTWAAAEAARRDAELHLVEVLPASDAAGLAGGRPQGRARALLYRAAETARAGSATVAGSPA